MLLPLAPVFPRGVSGRRSAVGQCQVTRDQFSVSQDGCPKENFIPGLPQLQGKGMCDSCACSRSLMKRTEKIM